MEASQVRVRFVTDVSAYRIADTPFVLPQSLNRAGLSDVVNHLLNNDEDGKVSFDFVVNGRLLRSTLSATITKHRLSTEDILIVSYFPLLRVRCDESESLELPSWIGCLDILPKNIGIAGCYDGSMRIFNSQSLEQYQEKACHQQPIRCLTSFSLSSSPIVATGSKDASIKMWAVDSGEFNLHELGVLNGHSNSVESLAFWSSPSISEAPLLLSGDWNGSIFGWSIAFDGDAAATATTAVAETTQARKKRKNNNAIPKLIAEAQPKLVIKAHAQAVTSIIAPIHSNSTIGFTASWDRSVKIWDWERQDSILTLSCGKAATSLDCAAVNAEQAGAVVGSPLLLASSHPDGKVRLWDGRASEATSTAVMTLSRGNTTTAWTAMVKWRPGSLQQLATVDYAGTVSLWDLRAVAPLFSRELHDGKALAMAWDMAAKTELGDDEQDVVSGSESSSIILSGGSDCTIRTSRINHN